MSSIFILIYFVHQLFCFAYFSGPVSKKSDFMFYLIYFFLDRFDLRQFLYNTKWTRQFEAIDNLVANETRKEKSKM